MGDYQKAKELLEKALKTDIANFGEQHPNVSIGYLNLAVNYYYQKDKANAILYCEKAVSIALKTLGENHPNTKNMKDWLEAFNRMV